MSGKLCLWATIGLLALSGSALADEPAMAVYPAPASSSVGSGYEPTPEQLGLAIRNELSAHPDVLMGMALAATLEQKRHEQEVAKAVLDYFGSHMVSMHHAVWIGDHTRQDTAFAFVDYSSIYASVFVNALNEFAHKNGVRILLLPGSMDERSRQSAILVTALAHGQDFGAFVSKMLESKKEYSGHPESYAPIADVDAAKAMFDDPGVVDDVDLAHLVLLALDMKQPMAMMYRSTRYVGNLADSDEMSLFYSKGDPAMNADLAAKASPPLTPSPPGGTPVKP